MLYKYFILLLILLIANISYAAFDNTFAGNARAFGMGGSPIALFDDATSYMINPAKVSGSNISNMQLAISYSPLFPGMDGVTASRNLISAAFNIKNIGTIGIGLDYLTVNDIYSEEVFYLSNSINAYNRLYLGFNYKFPFWQAGKASTSDNSVSETLNNNNFKIGLDFGALYRLNKLIMGLSIADLTTPRIDSQVTPIKERLPVTYKFGIAALVKKHYTLTTDMIYKKEDIHILIGNEIVYHKVFFIRFGMNFLNINHGTNITLGFGYKSNLFKRETNIDYGIQYPIMGLKGTYGNHRISILFKI